MASRVISCWAGMLLSMLRSTSNRVDARAKSSPLSRPFQPICPTVRTSWPFNSGTRSFGICSSSRTRNADQGLTG